MGERDASTSRAAQRGIESTSPSGGCLRFGELVGGKNFHCLALTNMPVFSALMVHNLIKKLRKKK